MALAMTSATPFSSTTFNPSPLPSVSAVGSSPIAAASRTSSTSLPTTANTAPSPLPSEYRRRRVIAVLLLVTALYVLWGLASLVGGWLVGTAEASDTLSIATPTTWVVEPGDTLWSVAESLDLSQDIRLTVDRLADANGGPLLQPGQVLDLSTARR